MSTKLRSNQRKAVEALLNGFNKSQAAAAAGVVPSTVSRWLSDPEFKAELSAGSDDALRAAAARFTGSLETAADVMTDIMSDSEADDNTRLRAADLVVNHAHKLTELLDLAERVAALENAQSIKSR